MFSLMYLSEAIYDRIVRSSDLEFIRARAAAHACKHADDRDVMLLIVDDTDNTIVEKILDTFDATCSI
jgi:hypothetical protein